MCASLENLHPLSTGDSGSLLQGRELWLGNRRLPCTRPAWAGKVSVLPPPLPPGASRCPVGISVGQACLRLEVGEMVSGVGAPPAMKAVGWGSCPPALQLLLVEP